MAHPSADRFAHNWRKTAHRRVVFTPTALVGAYPYDYSPGEILDRNRSRVRSEPGWFITPDGIATQVRVGDPTPAVARHNVADLWPQEQA